MGKARSERYLAREEAFFLALGLPQANACAQNASRAPSHTHLPHSSFAHTPKRKIAYLSH